MIIRDCIVSKGKEVWREHMGGLGNRNWALCTVLPRGAFEEITEHFFNNALALDREGLNFLASIFLLFEPTICIYNCPAG